MSANTVTANVRFLKFLMQNILLTIHHVLGSAKSAHARFQWDALNWTIRATQSNPIPCLDASLRGYRFLDTVSEKQKMFRGPLLRFGSSPTIDNELAFK